MNGYNTENYHTLFHDLHSPPVPHHSDWSVITAHNLTPFKRHGWNVSRVCL